MELPLQSHDVEKSISLARYVPVDEVGRAFQLSGLTRPWKTFPIQPYPFQPNPFTTKRRGMWPTTLLSCLGILAAQVYFVASTENREVFRSSRFFTPSEAGIEQLIGEIEIHNQGKNLEIVSHYPVDNSWVEVTYELESADGAESGWASQAIEYYHGNSGGEPWSEGSTYASSVIGPLGGNRYKVFATVDAANFSGNMTSSVNTWIITNVPIWSNFILSIFAILAFPTLCFLFEKMFERSRWAESDYSPYGSD